MKNEIHTIVTDLDGTLLDRSSRISELTRMVVQKGIDSGKYFIIATGRRFFSTFQFAAQFEGNIGLVSNNGQIIRMSHDAKRIREFYLDRTEVVRIVESGKGFGFFPLLHTDHFEEGIDMITEIPMQDPLYMNYSGGNSDRSLLIKNCLDFDLTRITVICILSHDKEKLYSFDRLLKLEIPDGSFRGIITDIPSVGPCMEIIRKDVSKWTGVQELLRINGSGGSGVISFGDELNDLELIRESGHGVAMSNGIDILKKNAKHISEYPNHEDGVAKTLIKLGIVEI
ncbi:MAG: HAD family hydrolase [Leptospira sp.]|nr:HAD family hydrolase [Leptospira sp.]